MQATEDLITALRRDDVVQATRKIKSPFRTPESLLTESHVGRLMFGNGLSIYESLIVPHIVAAETEVIIITCFWAQSETLSALNDGLRLLSLKAMHEYKTIRVRICFSSSSLFQKLFHTSSVRGRVWEGSSWKSQLGLPDAGELAGLDVKVTSIFILPFSVFHPKAVIIDGKRVLLPSCNVSWESWFEVCVELKGPVVEHFVRFWQDYWADESDKRFPGPGNTSDIGAPNPAQDGDHVLSCKTVSLSGVSSIFLPSPHHRNPRFTFPWATRFPAPRTPLNIYLLALFAKARTNIFIQTPNLTSLPVLEALVQSLKRGISVTITTSERLMVFEQLVTAGTTTKRCVNGLIGQHRQLLGSSGITSPSVLEAGAAVKSVGALQIRFYEPHDSAAGDPYEPVQSHVKLTVVDDEIAVFGSGNLDRASWYTSQELGVAFVSKELVKATITSLEEAMAGRSRLYYGGSIH